MEKEFVSSGSLTDFIHSQIDQFGKRKRKIERERRSRRENIKEKEENTKVVDAIKFFSNFRFCSTLRN